jgi:hypothetical protein
MLDGGNDMHPLEDSLGSRVKILWIASSFVELSLLIVASPIMAII